MLKNKFYIKIVFIIFYAVLLVNLYSCNKNVNYGSMNITNPKVFTNETFKIAFSVSIMNDRKNKSVDKYIEDLDIDFKFDKTSLEYIDTYVISTISEYMYDITKLKNFESIGYLNNDSIIIKNLKPINGKQSRIDLVIVFKAVKAGDARVDIKKVVVNNKKYIYYHLNKVYSNVSIKQHKGNDKNKFDAWYKDEFGKWYYYINDRTETLKGWFYDYRDNQKYYFDKETGIMAVGGKSIDGKSYYFNTIRDYWDNWYEIGDGFYESYGRERKTYGALLYP